MAVTAQKPALTKSERENQRQKALTAQRQEIGPILSIADPARRADATASLLVFYERYFPATFCLPWSQDHLDAIAAIERTILVGGMLALAMPRGSGKSALIRGAALWAIITGRRRYVSIVAATDKKAQDQLEAIEKSCRLNKAIAEDFPEVIRPVAHLGRITHRQRGQKHHGEPTEIEWLTDRLIFPSVRLSRGYDKYRGPIREDGYSLSSGSAITSCGLTGSGIRGQFIATADGEILRPDFVLLDDPQTRESATSPIQNLQREQIIGSDVLGMAGPGKKIAAFCCCTVVAPGDMADSLLNRDKHPEWHGRRTKAVYAFPANEKLWDEYRQLKADEYRMDASHDRSTAFYRERQRIMDDGASIAWPYRFDEDQISGVQYCMDLLLFQRSLFFAEHQNDPEQDLQDDRFWKADQIARKTNGYGRGVVPFGVDHLTAFIDIHDKLLYWALCGWTEEFAGFALAYGTYPDQQRSNFILRTAANTLQREFPGMGKEGAINAGLGVLVKALCGREWNGENGASYRVDRCLIDTGYIPEVVFGYIRQSEHAAVLLPARGEGIGASRRPIDDYDRKRGDRIGNNWWIPGRTQRQSLRTLHVDVNWWKSFVQHRLATAIGDKGCLSLFGDKGTSHDLLAEHLTAETPTRTFGQGRYVDEWKLIPSRDNHWLDCFVGCAAAASLLGASLPGTAPKKATKPANRPSLSELAARGR